MDETYIIPYSDTINSITLDPYSVDISTSLAFYGKNSLNYWTDLNKNVLLLLTSFSNGTPPKNPIKGQLWFDNTEKDLKYYDDIWHKMVAIPPDLSMLALNRNDTLKGNLILPNANPLNPRSISSRAYVESHLMKYTSGTSNNVTWFKYDNQYTVMYTSITYNKQKVTLPFNMANDTYSVIMTPNETTNKSNAYHYTVYNKTTSSFNVHYYDSDDTLIQLAIVIIGFAE